MPLPQQVVEQLSRESSRTPGWSSGIILFSGTVFGVVLLVYLGLTFGYTPYLNAQISQANDQIKKLDQSVSADDQTKLATFYSQVTNLHRSKCVLHQSYVHVGKSDLIFGRCENSS
jgi:uncharacterized membrane protein YvbJ